MGAAISDPIEQIARKAGAAAQKGASTSFGDAGQGTNKMGDLAGQVGSMGGKGASGASPMQFQQSAQATASQARTLAQQLNQYASQVETTAQALTH